MQRVWKYFFYKLEFAEAHEGSHWREAIHLQCMWKVFCFNFKLSNTSEDTHFKGVMTFLFSSTTLPCFQLGIIVMTLCRHSFPKRNQIDLCLPFSTAIDFTSCVLLLSYILLMCIMFPLLFSSQKAFSFRFLFCCLCFSPFVGLHFLEYWFVF